METLTYLFVTQTNEKVEADELSLNLKFSQRTTAGLLAVTSSLGTVGITAEAVSARGCCRSRPVVVRPVNRCYSPCYSRGYYGGYGGYGGYGSYSPSYGYGYDYGSTGYGGGYYRGGGSYYNYSGGGGGPALSSAAVIGPTAALPSSVLNVARSAPRPPAPSSSVATPVSYSTSSVGGSSPDSTYESSSSYSGGSTGGYSSGYSTQYVYHGDDGVASFGTYGELVTASQQRLKDLGYYTGEIDGLFGPLTEHAVTEYQQAQGLALVDGIIGPETLASLGV